MNRNITTHKLRFKNDDARHRSVPSGSLRATKTEVNGEEIPSVTLQMLSYFTVDSYGSLWMPGVLTAGIRRRLPQLAWSHNWDEVIGRALPDTYVDNQIGPQLQFYFNNFDDVPLARRIYSQIKDGTLDECSIGFGWDYIARDPTEEERELYPNVREVMIEAELDEVSIVLRGAVPNAKVVGVRSRERSRILGVRSPMMVDAEIASRLLAQVEVGDLSLLDALAQVKSSAVSPETIEENEEEKAEQLADEEDDTTSKDDKPLNSDQPKDIGVSEKKEEDTPPAEKLNEEAEETAKPEPETDLPNSTSQDDSAIADWLVQPEEEMAETPDDVEAQAGSEVTEPIHAVTFTDEELAQLDDVDSLLAEREVV